MMLGNLMLFWLGLALKSAQPAARARLSCRDMLWSEGPVMGLLSQRAHPITALGLRERLGEITGSWNSLEWTHRDWTQVGPKS